MKNRETAIASLENSDTMGDTFFDNRKQATEWMDIDEIATYLRTSVRHIRELVYKRSIPHSKLGRLLRFHRETVDKWMLSNLEES